MYSVFDHWAYLSHMLSVISMFSPCAQWVFGPLSPVNVRESAGPRKVGNKSKSCNPKLRFGAVEFSDNVGGSSSLSNDSHGTQIARLGFTVKGFFDASIPNEDKCTGLKVEVDDPGLVSFLEPFEILLSRLGDGFAHFRKVLGTFSELLGSGSDEFFGGNAVVLSGSEIGGLGNVEREERVNAVDHVVGGVTGRLSNGNSFSPEDLREDFAPLGLVTLAGLHDGFANVEVLGFHDPVGSRVVPRDANVVDTVAFANVVESGDVGGAVVGDELCETTPSTEDFLEDELAHDHSRVGSGSAPFWPGRESTASVKAVSIFTDLGHEEGVDMSFPKQ